MQRAAARGGRRRAAALQGVDRLASVLVLPHPEREAPEVRRLQPNSEIEATAMRVAIEHERAQGRQVYDAHEKDPGYDLTSLDLGSGQLRLTGVKGLAGANGRILLTANERRAAEDRRDCYWLHVVTDCACAQRLEEPIADGPSPRITSRPSLPQRAGPAQPGIDKVPATPRWTGRRGRETGSPMLIAAIEPPAARETRSWIRGRHNSVRTELLERAPARSKRA